ncbi:hypothetical protein [Ornithinimicrobium faecis]|uniref:Uncharacterized protein n=1 Tax=Ornithinimicrobium faecis TaxID=2934158 RepID=A0ABY4YYP6_9MICO|nr:MULTISPECIES: hypothetical protein [unclassified Ornithinimicrobium]USQ81896.1 hypothetical protein NF556_09735 [Ornithinimicrobium sp. HY1793]
MAGTGKNEGLSLWYRFWWQVSYFIYHVFGPAQLDQTRNPHHKLRTKRAAKVAAARAARLEREASQGA